MPRAPGAGAAAGAAPAGGVAFAPGHITNAPLKDPIQANSVEVIEGGEVSAPPIDSPAIARSSRFLLTLYDRSTAGITSSSRIFVYPVILSGAIAPAGPLLTP